MAARRSRPLLRYFLDSLAALDLLNILSLNKDTVAVELNKNIVHRQNFDSAILKDNDKLEIVTVVGGG